MAIRLASTAQQVLSASGIDVVASLTGGSRQGTFTLIDPDTFPQAERHLRRAGLRCSRRTAATVDVFLPHKMKKKQEDEGEAADFDTLISSWREFAKRSSDSGYKKAAIHLRVAGPGYNQIEAARQIGAATLLLSKRSPILRRIGKALSKAANDRDIPSIKKLLARLTAGPSSPRPVLKSPKDVMRRPEEDADDADIFATPAASVRTADPEDIAFSSAQRFLMDYAHENKLTGDQVKNLGTNPGKVMDSWRQSAPELPDHAYDSGWLDAATAVAQQLQLESRRASAGWNGSEEGITMILDNGREDFSNHGFAVTAAMDIPYDDKKVKQLVGRIIEHYVVDDTTGEPQHPSQITTAQVRSYLRKNAPEAPIKPVIDYLDKVTNRIPNRNEDRKKTNTASPAVTRRRAFPDFDEEEKPTSFKAINFGGAGFVVKANDGRYLSAFGKFPTWTSVEDNAHVMDSKEQANEAGKRALKASGPRRASKEKLQEVFVETMRLFKEKGSAAATIYAVDEMDKLLSDQQLLQLIGMKDKIHKVIWDGLVACAKDRGLKVKTASRAASREPSVDIRSGRLVNRAGHSLRSL